MRTQRMSDDAIATLLGRALRDRRLRKNITQNELAELTGVSTPTLQKLEKGKGTIANLISTLRGVGAIDLLVPLITPPPVSPLAVSRTGSPKKRIRAASSHTMGPKGSPQRERTGTSASVSSLLIPKKNHKGNNDGQDS
ncbi:helix-turn-helix domain-containing protein [Pseudomonas coleopterorum]|nr:helix-turn-helix domain-containing protein [Pseudomonas coleopterorum]